MTYHKLLQLLSPKLDWIQNNLQVSYFIINFFDSLFNIEIESKKDVEKESKKFFESYAKAFHFDPRDPANWYKQPVNRIMEYKVRLSSLNISFYIVLKNY